MPPPRKKNQGKGIWKPNSSLACFRCSADKLSSLQVMNPLPTRPSRQLRVVSVLGVRHWSTHAEAADPPWIFGFKVPMLGSSNDSVWSSWRARSRQCLRARMDRLFCATLSWTCKVVFFGEYRVHHTWSKLQTSRGWNTPCPSCRFIQFRRNSCWGWWNGKCLPGFGLLFITSPARQHTRWACLLSHHKAFQETP